MILLDTNILSAGLKTYRDPRIEAWMDANEAAPLCISAVTVAELCLAVERLADSRKKPALRAAIDQVIAEFNGLCLPFDALAAYEFGRIVAARRTIGKPIDSLDAQIAAIAIAGGLTLATLSVKNFEGIDGLTIVDPSA